MRKGEPGLGSHLSSQGWWQKQGDQEFKDTLNYMLNMRCCQKCKDLSVTLRNVMATVPGYGFGSYQIHFFKEN